MRAVIDASVALRVVLGENSALEVFARADEAHAPQLIVLEVANALRGLERGFKIDAGQAADAVALVGDLPVTLWDHRLLLDGIWQRRNELSAYDAAYLALAEALDSSLITADHGLAQRARAALGEERVRKIDP